MTTIAVTIFRPQSEQICIESITQDLEFAKLVVQDLEVDDIWVVICSEKRLAKFYNLISRRLDIDLGKICVAPALYGWQAGVTLLGNAIAYAHNHDQLLVVDASNGETLKNIDLRIDTKNAMLHRSLSLMELDYSDKKIASIVKILDDILGPTILEPTFMSQVIRDGIIDLSRFMKTYQKLLSFLGHKNNFKGSISHDFESLIRIDVKNNAIRLQAMLNELPPEFRRMQFAEPVSKFFGIGNRIISTLQKSRRGAQRDHLVSFFTWLSTYFLATAKEAFWCNQHNNALLCLDRAFELYLLAFLYRNNYVVRQGGDFLLRDGKKVGPKALWDVLIYEYREPQHQQYANNTNRKFENLRKFRNSNLLIHGFHIPNDDQIEQIRSWVKEAIINWEKCINGEDRLIVGHIQAFFSGEKWNDHLSKQIAHSIIDKVQLQM